MGENEAEWIGIDLEEVRIPSGTLKIVIFDNWITTEHTPIRLET